MKKIFLSTLSLILVFSMVNPSVSAQKVFDYSLGLVGYWKFDESSWVGICLTADILDSSGNGRHGTACINDDAPFPVPGIFGNAGSFDGINQYANMGPGFNFTSSFTAALWMALDDYDWCGPTGKSQHIIGTHHLATPAGNGRGWGIYWDCHGLAWELTDSTGSKIESYGFIEPSPFPANGSWHHIALVYDSTIPSATLYWDGVPVYSESGATNVPGFLYNNGEPLTVNGLPYAPSSGAPGKIDETRVYNRALSHAEIQTLFSNNPPVAVNDSYETDEDLSLNSTAPGLLENDSDPDGNPLTVVKVTDPANGTLNLNMDGSFVYIPNENYFGSDSFTYKANDGMWDSDIATVTITVKAVNDPPMVSVSAPADGSSFTEGDSISFTGTAADVEDGNLTSSLSWSSNLDGSIGTGSSFSTSTLSVGIHTVTAVVNDFGALEGSDQITITVEDTTAPDTTIDSQPPNPSGADVAFTFSSPDLTAAFECQLDNGGYAGCATPKNYIGLAHGPHIFDVRAMDGEGNVDTTPASFFWTVDTVSPSVVSITRTNGNPTGTMNVDFTIKFAESVSGVTVDDFGLYTTGVTGASVISLVSGSDSTYTVTVNTGSGNGTIRLDVVDDNTIIDAAGNPLGGVNLGDGNFVDGEVYEIIKPNTFNSIALDDGWILEPSETSGAGGTKNNKAALLRVGDNAANKQYRSVLSFDTSTLPEGAVITSVTLKFKHAGVTGTIPFMTHGKLLADICEGAYKTNPALQLADFNAKCPAGFYKAKVLTYTNSKVDNWYSQSLLPDNFQFINFEGVTQFRLRFAKDDNNDFGADFLKLFSGNALNEADRPQLVIEYYVP